jgi:hypothetical protein
MAMYDAWATYDPNHGTYFLGQTLHGFKCPFGGVLPVDNIKAAQEEAISFAAYRLIRHRFAETAGRDELYQEIDQLMESLGYDSRNVSTDYSCGAAELGNYIAAKVIAYGLQDGANEAGDYENRFYEPSNPPLTVEVAGNTIISDLNRWQPLAFSQFIDQSGNVLGAVAPSFVSAEWGQVLPFSLDPATASIYQRDDTDYWVYHDPGAPPYWDEEGQSPAAKAYKWGYEMVVLWSSLLDPSDQVMVDVSPASIGNIDSYPASYEDYPDFYNRFEGGDPGEGYAINPKTGQAYTPQIVSRADYARVLAEFWADGPDSETPPGHWFTIFNYVSDHPLLEKKWRGEGAVLDDLAWDIKGYFALGGTLHDVAISIWGIKGWYDTVRPVSAIRGMAELGQSSDPGAPNYHPGGLTLIPGYIELIPPGDPLAGAQGQFVNEIKVKAWRGPAAVRDPNVDVGGVDWVRANFWWPYQRPTFVSPPFAGYVSGHSAYSRAAAEVLTAMTGDAYFPGGMGEFYCAKNRFLVFELGPSEDVRLQWATYYDAADQCSLSRIYGGIHPPADDIPARLIGHEIGVEGFAFAEAVFVRPTSTSLPTEATAYPNPANCILHLNWESTTVTQLELYQSDGKLAVHQLVDSGDQQAVLTVENLPAGIYFLRGIDQEGRRQFEQKIVVQ